MTDIDLEGADLRKIDSRVWRALRVKHLSFSGTLEDHIRFQHQNNCFHPEKTAPVLFEINEEDVEDWSTDHIDGLIILVKMGEIFGGVATFSAVIGLSKDTRVLRVSIG